MTVSAATASSQPAPVAVARWPGPNTYTTTLSTANTPALTTATACSRALTGVGATIAAGSQRWKGMTAAFPIPNTKSRSRAPVTAGPAWPARMPPSRNPVSPVSTQTQRIAKS